ncbi:MAG: phosphoesterase [Rheinheimera sp.]|nr:MAG: phosphoesterase [Rheinheimera sp.]
MKNKYLLKPLCLFIALLLTGCAQQQSQQQAPAQPKRWLAGDHHIHTHYSVKWDNSVFPPRPIIGGDAKYSIPLNAQMASHYGLDWIVLTDHGGPNRAELALKQAYPELLASRRALPQILQFHGMEFDVPGNAPGGRHASFIMPYRPDAVVNGSRPNEAEQLFSIERIYNGRQGVPPGPEKAEDSYMLKALEAMAKLPDPPLVLANHPARLAKGFRQYFKITPKQLRDWQDTAPGVMIGMTGAEGHQAATLNADGSPKLGGIRGEYPEHPTYGGYDQMTARLGGVWDSLLSEGRRFWVTGVSDSHGHYTDGWADFWPGQYAKTYVLADKNYDAIFAALKSGQIFVTTGDLIDELDLSVQVPSVGKSQTAKAGESLKVKAGSDVAVQIRFRVPAALNGNHERPQVARLDVIGGLVTGPAADRNNDRNSDEAPQTRVLQRFEQSAFGKVSSDSNGVVYQLSYQLKNLQHSQYIRLRGTNQRGELEPNADTKGENPWSDLWFYSNPVFIEVGQ